MDMARRRVDLRLDEGLMARVDARAEELGQTRTKFIERALEKALGTEDGAAMAPAPPVRDSVQFEPAAPSRASVKPTAPKFNRVTSLER